MARDWKKNLPLWTTLFRMFAVPVIITLMIGQPTYWNWISSALFILASISDWLDGYWARKYKAETDLGRLLDPIADKFLVSSVLILLIPIKYIEALLVVVLLSRDILINGLRSFAAAQGKVIAAGTMGKWKTGVQMVAIPLILIHDDVWIIPTYILGYWGLWLSLGLSIYSGLQYTWGFFKAPIKNK